jgi:hypothetical protein
MGNLEVRLLATAALWGLNPDISQKYKMGDISKGMANTLYINPAKKYTKMLIIIN